MKLKKEYTLEEISQKYNCKIKGDKKTIINSICSLSKSKNLEKHLNNYIL